jgi:hypothetical protein
MTVFEEGTSRAGKQLAELTVLFFFFFFFFYKSVALKNPKSREAQARAQAADAFYNSVSGFPRAK